MSPSRPVVLFTDKSRFNDFAYFALAKKGFIPDVVVFQHKSLTSEMPDDDRADYVRDIRRFWPCSDIKFVFTCRTCHPKTGPCMKRAMDELVEVFARFSPSQNIFVFALSPADELFALAADDEHTELFKKCRIKFFMAVPTTHVLAGTTGEFVGEYNNYSDRMEQIAHVINNVFKTSWIGFVRHMFGEEATHMLYSELELMFKEDSELIKGAYPCMETVIDSALKQMSPQFLPRGVDGFGRTDRNFSLLYSALLTVMLWEGGVDISRGRLSYEGDGKFKLTPAPFGSREDFPVLLFEEMLGEVYLPSLKRLFQPSAL